MIGAFLFKAIFGLAVNLFQTRFSFSVAHRLSGQMWSYHFSQSLERMRGTDSGRILSEVNGWPLLFAKAFMVGGLMMANEISVISLIAIGLLVYNPVVFLSIAVLMGFGALIIRRATKKRLWPTATFDAKSDLAPTPSSPMPSEDSSKSSPSERPARCVRLTCRTAGPFSGLQATRVCLTLLQRSSMKYSLS